MFYDEEDSLYLKLRRNLYLGVVVFAIVFGVMSLMRPALYKKNKPVDFGLPTIDNRYVNISDYRGSVVFIDFFFPEDVPCPNANKAYERESGLIKEFEQYGVIFISISLSSDLDKIRGYLATKNKGNLVLFDPEEKFYQKFHRKGIILSTYTFPSYVILNKAGVPVFVSRDNIKDSAPDFYRNIIIDLLQEE